ncbi:nitroreductase family protein [Actinomadura sp. ATCC 31491]|uniref:Nitroreductase family protein n=1 Tax=Actinomadura luzonensis TaxID=2805427 RepID=A0ABT0FUA0_9ACTN|nr:nitroreductase family protein [Actinomadura luzonensis]MCK2215915.1 nitroreductase family protein [Actinomadura luzonensis]
MSTRTAKKAVEAALEAARWAPSVHNTQPWSFAVSGDEISLRADTERKLRVGDAAGRELVISCGAALFNMRTAIRCEGFEPVVRVLPDPDRPSLLALVRPGAEADADEHTWVLGGEIERRRTHRAGFTTLQVPARLVDALVRTAAEEGARLLPVGPHAVAALAALTQAAQVVQSQDRRYNLEVVRWARPPGSTRKDGVPAGAYPRDEPRTEPAFAQRDYAWRHEWGGPADQSGSTSPGVVTLLTTPGDAREDWLIAGQALQRVLLQASAHGVSAAFHTQALEMYHLREFLRHELCAGAYPQMVMRLGITFDDAEAVRRPVTDLL